MTRSEIETALDAGRIFTEMSNGRWWRVRRNGRTKTWVTRPDAFSIPVKAGIWVYDYITQDNVHCFRLED